MHFSYVSKCMHIAVDVEPIQAIPGVPVTNWSPGPISKIRKSPNREL